MRVGSSVSAAGLPLGAAAPSPKLTSTCANLDGLARANVDLVHAPAERGRYLDGRLVGLDLEERRVLADHVALAHEHLTDLGLGEAFAQVREDEVPGHRDLEGQRLAGGRQHARARSGTLAFSRAKPTNGTSYAVTRAIGASSERKAPSMIEVAISAPGPKLRGASWTTTARPVFCTEVDERLAVERRDRQEVDHLALRRRLPRRSVSAASRATRSMAP